MKKLSVSELVAAVNDHSTRECAAQPLLVVATCSCCGEDFAMAPQDRNRAASAGTTLYCHSKRCRQVYMEARAARRRAPQEEK